MAVGTGFGLDLSQLDAAIKNADEALKSLAKTGERTSKQINEAFSLAKNGNIQDFISVIERLSNTLGKKGYNQAAQMVREIATETTSAIDRVSRFATLMQTISDGGRSNVKNGAIESLKYQLDEALSRLGVLNERLQFYTKGEGAKAVNTNVVDTSALQDEANKLRVVVELLQRRLESEQALAALKQRSGAIENQQALNTSWQKMEEERTKQLQQQSINAKEANKAYEQSYNDRYQMYAVMYDKMWQEDLKHFERQNANAKSGGQQYAKEYEDRQRYYERWINEQFLREQENNKKIAEAKLAEEKRINQQISQDRIDQLGKESRERLKIEQMIRDTQRRNHEAREKELNDLFREQERQAKAQAKADSDTRKLKYKAYITSYAGAIYTSDHANTLAKEIKAVKNLEAARAKLNKTSADYDKKLANINNRIKKHNENIDKATKGTKKLREEHQSLGQAAGGLGRMLASAFSIQAIRGYINQMIKVRGEFELQQRSLQAILQNKDAADELWQKTIDLAVRSPFRVKELVTYTKQLAAYRIESDKLFETNKMLADVSAGLGVDMSRLILAFGQVRSASFLRGTELRQFTEAGIPMLEELAKYFTELEGRAVSVGDVFERISKRMVSFADVEEVFKRITSEGGTFYRMQEIQAETLQGQISNLKDSIDIMLNDMGKSYDSTLKNMVSLTKSLVDNWRTVSSIAIPIVGALVARWGIFKIATTKNAEAIAGFAKTFGRHFGVVITQLTRGTRDAKQFAESTQVSIMSGWATVILAVVAALTILVKTIQNANRVKRELEKIDLSGAFDASRSVAEYKRLAEVVADTSKSYDEQQKALSTLKTKYADILPSHLLESKTIKALGGDYGEATRAIYDYIAAKTKEKQIEVIQSEFGGKIEEQAQDLTDDIKKALEKVAPNIKKSDVLPIVNRLQEMIQLGEVDLFNVDETLSKLVMEFTGLEISSRAWKDSMGGVSGELSLLDGNAAQLVVSISNLKEKMDEVSYSSLSWQDSFVYQDFNKIREGYEKQSEAIGKYYETIRRYEQEREDKGENGVSDELRRDYEAATNALNNIFTEANQKAPQWSAIINEPFKLNEATINANKILWQKMITDINAMPVLPSKAGARQNYVELLEGELDAFAGTAKQQEVARVAQDLADTMRVSLEGLDELFLKSDESLSDYAKRISGTLEQYKTGVLQFDTDIENGTKFGDYTKEQVSLMREQIPFLEEFLKLFEAFLTPKKGTTEDTFSPMLRTVKEIYQEFKKLQGSFDDLTAKEGALAKFGDAFKEAFGKTPEQMGFDLFSEEGVKAAYDYLISKAPDAKKKIQAQLAKGEIVWDVKLQEKKDADKELLDDIQSLFDRYELTLDIKKLGMPKGLAEDLFNTEFLDLKGLREAVKEREAEFIGTDQEKQYKEFLEKIDEMERKSIVERTKTYSEYLMRGMTERTKLKVEELRKLKELEESKEFTTDQKKQIREQIQADSQKKLDKAKWEEFTGMDSYIMMFEDLETLGTQSIKNLYENLDKLRLNLSHLDPSDVKEIVNQMEKLQEEMIKRNPFKAFRDARKDIKAVGEDEETLINRLFSKEKIEAEAQAMIESISTIENAFASGTFDKLRNEDKSLFESFMPQFAEGKDLAKIKEEYQDILDAAREGKTITADQLKNFADYRKALQGISEYWGAINDQIQNIVGNAVNIMEVYGVDESTKAIAEGVGNMSMLITQAVQFGIQMQAVGYASNMALGVIGWVAMGIQAIATIITSIANYKNAQIDEQLESQAKKIERQRDLYEQIEKKVESAYNVDQLRQYNNEMARSVDLEIQALEASIALEKSRKNVDEEQVKDYEMQIAEARERLAESTQGMMEELGGIFDLSDFTSGFVDAWWDAMDEGMSGLDALSDHFEDTMKDMVKKQALYRGAQEIMSQVQDAINKSLEGDFTIDEGEWQAIMDAAKKANVNLDTFLQGWYDMFGAMSEGTGSGLSGLQKGISGMSEQQAEILTAYWNSVRGYTASIDSKMDLILSNLNVSGEDNPMLAQLMMVAKNTSAINTLLSSLVKSGHTLGGSGIKVFMS